MIDQIGAGDTDDNCVSPPIAVCDICQQRGLAQTFAGSDDPE
jgi:hypothetical protein